MNPPLAYYTFMEPCVFCDELITYADAREDFADGRRAHRNCALRQVIGSVAHLEKRCSCYVKGSEAGDPPEMSRREAADAAAQLWLSMQKKECQ